MEDKERERLLEYSEKDRLKIVHLEMDIDTLHRQILILSDIDNMMFDDQIYETMRLQNKLLREENKTIKVERNKAVRQLESIKKKLLKLGE